MSLRKRLARVERALANTAKQKEQASCICRDITTADTHNPGEFEAEMNRPCPAHGVRQLGRIMVFVWVKALNGRPDTSGPKDPRELELERLLEVYRGRQRSRSIAGQVGLDPEYDSKKL